jgi:hypothetical protein
VLGPGNIPQEGPDIGADDQSARCLAFKQALDAHRVEHQRGDELRVSLEQMQQLFHALVIFLHGFCLLFSVCEDRNCSVLSLDPYALYVQAQVDSVTD